VTVSQAAELWIEHGELTGLERTTVKQYRSHVDQHIAPRIGTERLSRLTTPRLEAFADSLQRDLSRAMARKVLTSTKSILTEAQRRGLIAHNPCLPVRINSRGREEHDVKIPTKADMKTLLQHVPDRWRPLLVTAMLTGLRTSELRGLTWQHVDFDNRIIRVRQRADAFNEIGKPKSRAGRRDVPMSPLVLSTLREWRLRCPKRKTAGDGFGELHYVFPNKKGSLLHPPDILRQCWYPLLTSDR
jgi:integrase